jgi:hypothetical protein
MQPSPHALPLLQTRQQLRGSSVGLVGFAGGGRRSGGCGSLRTGFSGACFSGACCAIASTAGAAVSTSTTSNTYLSLVTISRQYPRRSRSGGVDRVAHRRGEGGAVHVGCTAVAFHAIAADDS